MNAPLQHVQYSRIVALALLAALVSSCSAASKPPSPVESLNGRAPEQRTRAAEPHEATAGASAKPPASGAGVTEGAPARHGTLAAPTVDRVATLRDLEVNAVAGPDGRITVTKNGATTATVEARGAARFSTRTHYGRLFVFAAMPPMPRSDGTQTWAQWRVVEVLADGTALPLPDLDPSPEPQRCKWASDIHFIGDPAIDVKFGFDVHCTGEGWRCDLELRTWWNPDKRAYVHSPIGVLPRGGG